MALCRELRFWLTLQFSAEPPKFAQEPLYSAEEALYFAAEPPELFKSMGFLLRNVGKMAEKRRKND